MIRTRAQPALKDKLPESDPVVREVLLEKKPDINGVYWRGVKKKNN